MGTKIDEFKSCVSFIADNTDTFDFYINEAYAGTVTGGPTCTATSRITEPVSAADNGAHAGDQKGILFDCTIFQGL